MKINVTIELPEPVWYSFDNVDLPQWVNESFGQQLCSFLNGYIPREHTTHGTGYQLLNRYPNGKLYFHLLNCPTNL